MLRKYLDWDIYVLVSRAGACFVDESGRDIKVMGYEESLERLFEVISNRGVGVIDEFQRLPEYLWDFIALKRSDVSGRLVLCGSSLSIVRKVFSKRSPLLGLFAPFKVDLVFPADSILAFAKILDFKNALLWACIARDPWILGVVEVRRNVVDSLKANYSFLAGSVTGLIGEIFEEEERKLTRLYDAVLRLLAYGYWSSRDLAQKLYEARLIQRPEPGIVTGILDQLVDMGLVEKIRLWRTRGARVFYRHRSSILSILLYFDEKYSELGLIPSRDSIEGRLGLEVQFFIGELLARYKNLTRAYALLPKGGDVDIVLLDKGSPVIGYEVKVGSMTLSEARRAIENMKKLGIPRYGLISLEGELPRIGDEQLTAEDLVKIAEEESRKYSEEA
ncbi:MAG: hypothetical protein DRJ63_03510 [Thermoprotei archaeon]|nr:MAG: hypothetical protein DRJ63_03510 [Thermoprotei archaeon]